jgi:cyclopropane fatty-acyl-phospholipid synthase-like methyltransferase
MIWRSIKRFRALLSINAALQGDTFVSKFYGASWNTYVKEMFDKTKQPHHVYPGDEWGNPEWWNITYARLLTRAGSGKWEKAVEIGAGSGKYTDLLLKRSACSILAADVSVEFLNVLKEREKEQIDSGRLHTYLMPGRHPGELYHRIDQLGWVRQCDALFSIDAMVHVDLQFLAAYFVTAAVVLKQGGKLVLTLADAASKGGQQKLLEDLKVYYPMQGSPSLKFEFISVDIVRRLLDRLGFGVQHFEWDAEQPDKNRDLWMIAELTNLSAAEDAKQYLDLPTLRQSALRSLIGL